MTNTSLRFSQLALLTGLKRHAINARAKTSIDNKELKRSPGNQVLLNSSQVKQLISDRIHDNICGKIIYIGNLKGGVGKTSIAYLLANAISMMGLKTCAIDLDVQANLTNQYLNIDVKQPVFFDVIDNTLSIQDVIVNINSQLDLIPSSLRNSLIQKSLSMQSPKHHLAWFNTLCLDFLRDKYDVILVDTPPHLTTLNSVFCLCLKESDHVAIPACAEDFSIMGVQMFLEDIFAIRESYNVSDNPGISIVMNRFFQTQKTNLEMLVKMGQSYGSMLSDIVIRDSAKIREVVNNKIPLSDLKNGKEVYETVSSLLKEFNILKNIEN